MKLDGWNVHEMHCSSLVRKTVMAALALVAGVVCLTVVTTVKNRSESSSFPMEFSFIGKRWYLG